MAVRRVHPLGADRHAQRLRAVLPRRRHDGHQCHAGGYSRGPALPRHGGVAGGLGGAVAAAGDAATARGVFGQEARRGRGLGWRAVERGGLSEDVGSRVFHRLSVELQGLERRLRPHLHGGPRVSHLGLGRAARQRARHHDMPRRVYLRRPDQLQRRCGRATGRVGRFRRRAVPAGQRTVDAHHLAWRRRHVGEQRCAQCDGPVLADLRRHGSRLVQQ